MKKLILLFLIVACSTSVQAQQKKFKDIRKYKGDYSSSSQIYLSENPEEIDPVEEGTKLLILQFSLDPESTDEQKEVYIATLLAKISQMGKSVKSPLDAIIIQVGEQIFLTRAEVNAASDNRKKMANMNLEKAWQRLGPELNKSFPEISYHALNWNW
jgi:hypothetical protein